MKYVRYVCLIALAWASLNALYPRVQYVRAQTAMQRGISVELSPTLSAAPMPKADRADAWIVTVVRDGGIYFGADKVTPESLLDKMKSAPRHRDAKLYIKADAHARFKSVDSILADARVAFNTAVFLTSQRMAIAPGKIVPPNGLAVSIGPESALGADIVELLNSGSPSPTLRVNGHEIEHSALKNTLESRWRSGIPVVLLKSDGEVDFQDIVHVVDVSNSLGARVMVH